MRYPGNRAARVWVDQHFAALGEFLHSGRRDRDALARAARALAHMLERDSTYAAETRQLAVRFVMANWNAGWPAIIADAVRSGLDADLVAPELRPVPAPAALLHIFMAETRKLGGERLPGLDSIGRAIRRLGDAPHEDLLAQFLLARAFLLRAELQEYGREDILALPDFRAADSLLSPLMQNESARATIATAWTNQIFGPADDGTLDGHGDGIAAMALQQFDDSFVRALLGAFRTDPNAADADGLATMRDAIDRHGLATAVNPILVLPALSRLDPERGEEFGAFLTQAATDAPAKVMARSAAMLEGLDPALRSSLTQLSQVQADPAMVALWALVTRIAKANSMARIGDAAGSVALLHATVGQILGQAASAVGQALAIGEFARQLAVGDADQDFADSMSDMFLLVFEAAWRADPEALHDLRYRSQFDPLIAAVAGRRLAQQRIETEQDLQTLSVLLDLLRVVDLPSALGLTKDLPLDGPNEELCAGFARLGNTLSRAAEGIAGRAGAVAVISHDATPETGFFILVTERGIQVEPKDAALSAAFADLADAVDGAPEELSAGGETFDPVRQPAEAAWWALPTAVREAIAAAEVLHLAPDFRGSDASEPWEMIHDGNAYLLASAVVVRHGSLKQLARAFDTRIARPSVGRALVLAAPHGDPDRPLPAAEAERASVGDLLRAHGIDAPDIPEERLAADFVIDRLPWVDALHIAAHGEQAVGTEFLVLSPKDRLTVDDLLARPRRSMPFVYLSTCDLGRTRYVGGGQARGLAFTLAELGAPAVMANTGSVLDEVSADVALAFYDQALGLNVGQALLSARRRVSEKWHPALVSSVILFGDADHCAFGSGAAEGADAVGAFLDAYFDGRDDDARLAALNDESLIDSILTGGRREAAALDLVNGFAKVTADEPYECRMDAIGHAIELADELHHPCAMAMLRYIRASFAMDMQDDRNMKPWMADAIAHLDAVDNDNFGWTQALTRLRSALRRDDLAARGLELQHHGPPDDSGSVDAFFDVKLAVEQAQEMEFRPVEPRDVEEDADDILWNAVIAGHPNRFEDTAEASDYAEIVTRKLIAIGAIGDADFDVARPMITALAWWLWSHQATTFLAADVAEGQAGTLAALIDDIASDRIIVGGEPWRRQVLGFDAEVASVLAELEAVPWESAYKEIPERLAALGARGIAILDAVERASPDDLAWTAALVSGVLATRNRFSVLACEDYLYDGMVAAHQNVDAGNEHRFMRYLVHGFASVREREQDELARWRMAS
ncbi:CHAT domain-containing protein [Sphingomonas sp. SUN019]|uniref:CHAT domain-containing protein n=1 Tax=Sphingomonas sp. SUN019 TaxID=2937788 RepID=UPI0021642541|nr:CHAT domain-containing protein [Sphingomonas sp. SUN019]UVO50361.1 CHAT domain-containing protein [Sphingomonas sp. SUN019]